jgi:hexosaminidase
MPAHAKAAIASYLQLSCLDSNGKEFPYPSQIQGEFCTRDETFTFLTDILSEVMEIFPGKYIHIGGDEAEKETWKTCRYCVKRMKEEGLKNVHELQTYFISRIEKFVNSKGRSIIGWDEIMEGGVAPNAAIMSWTGMKNGTEAAKQEHEVVMTPLPYCYFDHAQSDDPQEPDAYPGLTRLSDVYSFEPVPKELTASQKKYILGAQGNLWTEHMPTASKFEYMLFPRGIALAEVDWSQPEHKNYKDFVRRLHEYTKRLDLHNVNYSPHLYDIRLGNMVYADGKYTVSISGGEEGNEKIYYTLDRSRPDIHSPVVTGPVQVTQTCTIAAAIIRDGKILDVAEKNYVLHKAVGKKGTLSTRPSDEYNKGGIDAWHNGSLTDDKRKNDLRNMDEERYNDDQWSGWFNQAFEGTIDLGRQEPVKNVAIRFYHNVPHGVIIPRSVSIQVSNDGVNFKEAATRTIPYPDKNGAVTLSVPLSVSPRFLKVIAEPFGQTPRGNNAWLFVDEVIVE